MIWYLMGNSLEKGGFELRRYEVVNINFTLYTTGDASLLVSFLHFLYIPIRNWWAELV